MEKNRFGRRKNEDTGRAAANKRWAERLWTGLLFLNVFTVLLTGCSRGAENEEGLKTQGSIARTEAVQEGLAEVTYAAKFHLLPKDRWKMHANACYYDGEYYCRVLLDTQEGIYGIGKVGFDGNESDWIYPPLNEDEGWRENLLSFCVTAQGEIHALMARQTCEEDFWNTKAFFFVVFDERGKETRRVPLQGDQLNEYDFLSNEMDVDANGNYLLAGRVLRIYSPEGQMTGQISLGEEVWFNHAFTADNGVTYIQSFDGMASHWQILDSQKQTLQDAAELPMNVYGIGRTDREGMLLVYGQEGVWQFDQEKARLLPMLRWSELGVRGETVIGVGQKGDGILAYSREAEVIAIEPREEGNGPKELVIAVAMSPDSDLVNVATAFNRSQSDWIVKIKNYGKDVWVSTQAQEPINRMMIDVLGEEPPDLIDVSLCFGTNLSPKPKDLMEQGYVEDLYPYLEKGNALSVDDLEEKVLEYFEVNGKLVTIPRKYSLRLLLVDGAVFGDGDRWSVEEMMEYDRLHPDKTLFTDCTAESVLPVVLLDQLESFVSIEQKSVNLDHALFRESLKYAASYPDTKKEIYFSRDDQLVKFCTIEKWIDIQCLQKEWYEGRGKLVGYPTVDGSFRTKIMPTGQALAICSKSKNKEGAWRFLEFFLEDDQGCFGMDGVMKAGFPVNKKILRRMEEEQSAENGPLRTDRDLSGIQMRTWNPEGNGEYYSLHPITAEERQMVKKILEGADVREMQYFDLKQMVREECEPYFAGQKSLEETIRVIQNRVNLYLQE